MNSKICIQRGFNIKYSMKFLRSFFQKATSSFLRSFLGKATTPLFLNLFHNEGLKSITLADVVEFLDADATLYSLPPLGEGGPQLLATVVDEVGATKIIP